MRLNRLLYQHITWRVLSMALQFIFNILFARYFQAETSGAILYVFAVNAFLIQITGLSLEAGLGYFGSAKKIATSRLAGFALMWSVLATVVSLICLLAWHGITGIDSEFPLHYSVAFIAGNLLIAFANSIFYSRLDFFVPNIVSLVINALLLALMALMFEIDRNYAPVFVEGYFFCFLLQGIILFLILLGRNHIRVSDFLLSRKEVLPVIRFSLSAFVANLLFLGITRVDYIFLRYLRSAAELGNYIQVSKIAQVFFVLPSLISAVLFPFIASGESVDSPRTIRKISLSLIIVYLAGCLLLAAAGQGFFEWLYGQSFDQMYVPFLLLIPGIIAISGVYPYTAYFAAKNKIKVNIAGASAAFLFILVTDAIFVPLYGIVAAAAISSAGYLIYYAYVARAFKNEQVRL